MVKKINAIILSLVLCLSAMIVPTMAAELADGMDVAFELKWDKEYYNPGDTATLSVYMKVTDDMQLGTGSFIIGLNSAQIAQADNSVDDIKAKAVGSDLWNSFWKDPASSTVSWLASTIVTKVQAKNTAEENALYDQYMKIVIARNTASGTHENATDLKYGLPGSDINALEEPIITFKYVVSAGAVEGTALNAAITTGSLTSSPAQTAFKYIKAPGASTTANVDASAFDVSAAVATATVGKEPCADNAHQWDNGVVTTEPTCGKEGITTYTCTVCNHTKEERDVPATGNHTEGEAVQENVVPASCNQAGSYDAVVYCTVCNAEISRTATPIPATGKHNFATETDRQEPTCTEDGYVEMSCGCGEKEKTTLPKTGHTEVVDEAVAPTCKETGLTEGKHCSVCNAVLKAQTEVPAAGHDYDSVVTPPTCTEGGYTTYTCSVCGDAYTADETTATGHNYVEEVIKNPTCTKPGRTKYTCSGCGDNYMENLPEAVGHTLTTEAGKEATCTEPGYTAREWCTVCNTVTSEKIEIPAIGHSYTTVVTPPTCTTAGYTTYTCSVCNDSYTGDEVAALGHTEGDVPVVENEVEATCTEDGSYDNVYFCSECGEESSRETVIVEATGHSYDDGVVTAPTETEEGYTTYTCTECGESYQDDFVDALAPETPEEEPEKEPEKEPESGEDKDEPVKDETTDENDKVTDVVLPDTDSLQVVSPMILFVVLAFVLMATTIVLKKKRRE